MKTKTSRVSNISRTQARCQSRSARISNADAKPPGCTLGRKGSSTLPSGWGPDIFDRTEVAIGAVDQLTQLARGVDVPISCGVEAVALRLGQRFAEQGVTCFSDIIIVSALLQMPCNVLGEATACGLRPSFRV